MKSVGLFVGQKKTHIERGYARFKIPFDTETDAIKSEIEQDFENLCVKIIKHIAEQQGLPYDYVKENMTRFSFLYDVLEPEMKQVYS